MSHGQDGSGPSPSVAQILVNEISGATGNHQKEANAASSFDSALNQSDSEFSICKYLQFLRISKINKVYDILSANDIKSHKIFLSFSSLNQKEVIVFGLWVF